MRAVALAMVIALCMSASETYAHGGSHGGGHGYRSSNPGGGGGRLENAEGSDGPIVTNDPVRPRRTRDAHVGETTSRRVPLVEEEVEDGGHGRKALRSLRRARRLEVRSAATSFLARVIRCSIATSVTRNARAISETVRPQTTRSASP